MEFLCSYCRIQDRLFEFTWLRHVLSSPVSKVLSPLALSPLSLYSREIPNFLVWRGVVTYSALNVTVTSQQFTLDCCYTRSARLAQGRVVETRVAVSGGRAPVPELAASDMQALAVHDRM